MENSEERFGPDEDIGFYNPDMLDGGGCFLDEELDANFTSPVTSPAKPIGPKCRTCLVHFTFNNKLHHHLRKDDCKSEIPLAHTITQKTPSQISIASLPTPQPMFLPKSQPKSPLTSLPTSSKSNIRRVIDSTVNPNQEIGAGYGFRGWKYATGMVSLTDTVKCFHPESCCLTLGITLVDRNFFQRQAGPRISIRTIATPITV